MAKLTWTPKTLWATPAWKTQDAWGALMHNGVAFGELWVEWHVETKAIDRWVYYPLPTCCSTPRESMAVQRSIPHRCQNCGAMDRLKVLYRYSQSFQELTRPLREQFIASGDGKALEKVDAIREQLSQVFEVSRQKLASTSLVAKHGQGVQQS